MANKKRNKAKTYKVADSNELLIAIVENGYTIPVIAEGYGRFNIYRPDGTIITGSPRSFEEAQTVAQALTPIENDKPCKGYTLAKQ